ADADDTVDVPLGAGDVGGDVLVVRAEPEAVVDEFGVLISDIGLELDLLLREGHRLQRTVRGVKNDRGRSLIDFAALDTNQAVLNLVETTDAVLTAELVEPLDQVDGRQLFAIDGHRHAALEA